MNFFIKFIFAILFIACIDQIYSYMPNQLNLLKAGLQKSGQIINCSGCDLRGAQGLAGLDMHGIFMPGVSMQPCVSSSLNNYSSMICVENQAADLTEVNLSQAVVTGSCLDKVILKKANLTEADLSYSSVQSANLQDAIVEKIVTTGASFCNTIMPDGSVCKDSWTGQGVTIDCNCSQDTSK